MELSFSSREALYKRVKPALRVKKRELEQLGFSYIREIDIWNYLIESRWKKGHALMLSDVVSDILHVEYQALDSYVKKRNTEEKKQQTIPIEII